MNRLLFFDLDGTLAMPGKPPGKETVRALQAARAKGHGVFLSTGRPPYSIPEEIRAIGFDGGIYCAGGRILLHGETIFDQPMRQELSRGVVEVLRVCGVSFNLECAQHHYRHSAPGEGLSAIEITRAGTELQRVLQMDQKDPHGRPFRAYAGEPVYKVSFRAPSRERFEEIQEQLAGAVKVVCFENLKPGFPLLFCEVSDPGIHKGSALERFCQHCHMSIDQSVAFGDSMNDAEILRTAGIGVAMGNGEDSLKALADRICESCEEDGVAKELARLGLL